MKQRTKTLLSVLEPQTGRRTRLQTSKSPFASFSSEKEGNTRAKRLAATSLALAFSACTVGPNYHTPDLPKGPAQWGPERNAASRTVAGQIDLTWWRSFGDPELDSLVARLGQQNLDLQAAAQRIGQARSQMQVAAAAGLPQMGWSGGYAQRKLSTQGIFSLAQPAPGASFQFDFFSNTLSAGWDLDLFGMVRRAVEAQRAGEIASIAARRGVALAAVSDLATSYMQLRGVQEQSRIARENLELARSNEKLVQSRVANGVATTLEQAQARAEVSQIASTLPELSDREATLINAIGLLLAEPPRALELELARDCGQPAVPLTVPTGLPADLAHARPDIMVAEARLHEATAGIGMAKAAFYPDITLTGNIGTETLSASQFFSLPARQFAVGPTLSLPIFQGGRLTATLELRKAEQQEAAINFRKTVLGAWSEVDNAMTAYAEAQRTRTNLQETRNQDKLALLAARQQYSQGATDFLNVVTAQTALVQADGALAANQTVVETTLVSLYRALGGGWEYAEGRSGRQK